MLKKTITILALTAALFAGPAVAGANWEQEENASNHGFATAAYEIYCDGLLTVSNPKLRAKLYRLYRSDGSRWRKYFLQGYEFVAYRKPATTATPLLGTCTIASSGEDSWPEWIPAAGAMTSACRISSPSLLAGSAAAAAPMSGRCLSGHEWEREAARRVEEGASHRRPPDLAHWNGRPQLLRGLGPFLIQMPAVVNGGPNLFA